jgi:multiple sugar transport system substrate-binding protein
MLEGPAGRVSVVHGVAAVGSAKTKHVEETVRVLKWMGSAEGQKAIAEGGYAFPGVTSAQQGFADYWSKEGVDVKPFIDAASGETIPAPIGPRANAGATAVEPILKEVFLGRKPVAEGLAEAEQAGNEAIKP